ncbi:CRISPR-associated protein [Vitreoscilla filiformis]|uniref:CRISPR-associated protein n=1 Tax=Vitreoscilla filiformis TaxID=63 RepID=A0A221KGU6_VITFI|nr:CRISPR-associated helicase/endonuclease Cas3 [Vitreoscilla filiformis]ASM78149.1 CRISPR-associated protein [Vitreoscilla filiformis]
MTTDSPRSQFIAHVRETDCQARQSLESHLHGVGRLSSDFADKFGLSMHGLLIGMLHDLGKYSTEFQRYILSATGLLNQDEDDEYVDAKGLKGKIDHSSSGAQFVWKALSSQSNQGQFAGQVLALCMASHHSGLVDCLSFSEKFPVFDNFSRRMSKTDQATHLTEVCRNADPELMQEVQALLNNPELINALWSWRNRLARSAPGQDAQSKILSPALNQQIGLLVRALFSCLIDADRIDTADFEHPRQAISRPKGEYRVWDVLIERLESHLAALPSDKPVDASKLDINELRRNISAHCLEAASRSTGIYTLSVPTGGGKTLASLRFALHHARQHNLDRIIYVIPFTSIIDQNAQVVRHILEPTGEPIGSVVLEHHSNLTPEQQSWRSKMLSESWDAPVVYTTTVQLLETLFSGGTRGARRMHQLARSVLVFDEVQTLPINCVHLFNNAMNFLADHCRTTVVLCTATQPLLDKVDLNKGAVRLKPDSELMPNVRGLFDSLKRVEVVNLRKPGGWGQSEVIDLAFAQVDTAGSCLVIVNTKKAAQALYELCKARPDIQAFHLSTSMCPAHRKERLKEVIQRLSSEPPRPTLCISTQLIEAGVDVDFGTVIRYAAGLDSIAQAAGRCNRNGKRATGFVYVLNPQPEDENLTRLPDIEKGREIGLDVLNDYQANPEYFDYNPIGPEVMKLYYERYFFARTKEMSYTISRQDLGRDDTLLNLLSLNNLAVEDYKRAHRQVPPLHLRQSFMTAGKAFKAIDTPTQGVIVPYGSAGRELVNDLCAAYQPEKEFDLLRQAQQYSVNIFTMLFDELARGKAIREIRAGTGIFHLVDTRYYHEEFGLSDKPNGDIEVLYA